MNDRGNEEERICARFSSDVLYSKTNKILTNYSDVDVFALAIHFHQQTTSAIGFRG